MARFARRQQEPANIVDAGQIASQSRARSVPECLLPHAALIISLSTATVGPKHPLCVATAPFTPPNLLGARRFTEGSSIRKSRLGRHQENMKCRNQSWRSLLRHEGSDFLQWVKDQRILSTKFDALATALSSLLRDSIRTAEQASDVWKAVPAVLGHCNERGTYEMPGAAFAYAWLHLLDRYVRTWVALELLVERNCLPMGKNGVHALDVGTGPGPSAFAIHDFYASMIEFSETRDHSKWRQPPHVTCVEFDGNTNHLRHLLAEILFEQGQRESEGVLAMCLALADFGKIEPTRERMEYLQALRNADETYFDEGADQWTSDLLYLPEEANYIAQSQHRYRLITFSNFLTTVGTVKNFEPNLVDVLRHAAPGTVLLVLGGKGDPYPKVYQYTDRLAKPAGFELEIRGTAVSCAGSEVADRVYEEGRLFYEFLQGLSQNKDDATKRVREEFEGQASVHYSSSEVRAYRKHRDVKSNN